MVKDKSSNSRIFDEDGYRKVIFVNFAWKFIRTKTTTNFPFFPHFSSEQRVFASRVKPSPRWVSRRTFSAAHRKLITVKSANFVQLKIFAAKRKQQNIREHRRIPSCLFINAHFDYTQVLLVSSSKYPERWIVPGGGVEQDETNAETAVRELLEEAGVVGRLGRCLGVFEVSNKKVHNCVTPKTHNDSCIRPL